jgi:CBS domain-containing protein
MKVRDCMTHNVRLVSPDDTVQAAATMMKEIDAGVLPVGEDDRLVGMITDRDIAIRAVADGRGPQTPVREAMTREVRWVFEDEDLAEASDKMCEAKVRRLPVLSRDKRMVGIVSLGDLAMSDSGSYGAHALEGVSEPGGPHVQH